VGRGFISQLWAIEMEKLLAICTLIKMGEPHVCSRYLMILLWVVLLLSYIC